MHVNQLLHHSPGSQTQPCTHPGPQGACHRCGPRSSLTDLHDLGGDLMALGLRGSLGTTACSLWASRTPWLDTYNSLTWEVYVITVERGGRRGSGLS